MSNLTIIDSHTGGEPTRTVVSGGPALGKGSMAERLSIFQRSFDHYRTLLMHEPRGSDVMVGALLCKPVNPENAAGVIFFNNVGYLGMCGHGTIGLAATLFHLGKIEIGTHTFETPVGDISVKLHSANRASITNVASFRYAQKVKVMVPDLGEICGDVAWGGNWFFLVEQSQHRQILSNSRCELLTEVSWKIRQALKAQKITGENGAEIDHVELFGPPTDAKLADSQSFVLCPGKAYDRSPCGTGTSAKLACLFADGKIKEGQVWRQQSIIGSVFEGEVKTKNNFVIPTITGEAFITLKAEVLSDPNDPFRFGVM